MEDTDRGRLTVLGAVVVIAVTLAWLLGIHLYLAYRGFRWLVAGSLLFAGASIAFTLATHEGRSAVSRVVPLVLLGIASVGFAALLVFSRATGAYLSERRADRSFGVAVFLAAMWVVLGAAATVLVWVALGRQAFG